MMHWPGLFGNLMSLALDDGDLSVLYLSWIVLDETMTWRTGVVLGVETIVPLLIFGEQA